MIRDFDQKHGVQVLQAGHDRDEPAGHGRFAACRTGVVAAEERYRIQARQGRGIFGVDRKIVDDEGHELPWDARHPVS